MDLRGDKTNIRSGTCRLDDWTTSNHLTGLKMLGFIGDVKKNEVPALRK